MKRLLAGLLISSAAALAMASPPAVSAPPIKLWRLDCGKLDANLARYSDTGLYSGKQRTLVASCYLIKSGDRLLLWDTGIDGALAGKPKGVEGTYLNERLVPQLARIGVKPTDVTFVGISHYHYDHTGQVADFPSATLLIGKEDFEVVKSPKWAGPSLQTWISGDGKVELVEGDKDIFGDGRVLMLALPGHTPGHHGLYVRLASGPVLLTGDQYHFSEQVENHGVPPFNHNRADTLASHDRFERIARNFGAKMIIQHEPADVAKLPAFPNAAQ